MNSTLLVLQALNTFITADELHPGMNLVEDNLKALQEHLDFRESQRKGSGSGDVVEEL